MSLTPCRDVFVGEVIEGDVITTEQGQKSVVSVFRSDAGFVRLFYQVGHTLESVTRPAGSLISIRDVAVIS